MKQIIIPALAMMFASCGSQADKKDFEHNYTKYWQKYSEQQLVDTLFSDTLNVGPDNEDGWTTREFYINTTKELLADLKDDQHKIDSLYPMTAFDEIIIENLSSGIKKYFSHKETERFLEIINDPVSFDWAETTPDPPGYRVDFLKRNKVVASMTIDPDKTIIHIEPGWPGYKKIKFGRIKPERYWDFVEIID